MPFSTSDLRDPESYTWSELADLFAELACEGLVRCDPRDQDSWPSAMVALVEHGLAQTSPEGIEPAPADVAARVLARGHVKQAIQEIERWQVATDTLVREQLNAQEPGGWALGLSVLTETREIWEHANSLHLSADHEFLSLETDDFDHEPAYPRSVPQEITERGVRLRTVQEAAGVPRIGGAFPAIGEEIRVMSGVPVKMVMADDREAVVALTPTAAEGALLVRNHYLLGALRTIFDLCWEVARPVESDSEGPLSARQRVLLSLMGKGFTDGQLAHRLDLSERTVRRSIAELLELLGARSRFAAGVEAHRRGFV